MEEKTLESVSIGLARRKSHACGVQVAWSEEPSIDAAVASIAAALNRSEIGQLLVFFSPSRPASALSRALSHEFAGIPVAGCTTSGQISPDHFSEVGILALAFPKKGFRVVSQVLQDIHGLSIERAIEIVRSLRAQLDRASAGQKRNRFALSFIDGLSNTEEMIVSALGLALNDIPLVGGSAGDNLLFTRTALLHNGEVHHEAALLLLIETDCVVRTFKHDNFQPTDRKLVVTASDSERRTVLELNAECAAREYASAAGLDDGSLTPMSFAAHPVVVRVRRRLLLPLYPEDEP